MADGVGGKRRRSRGRKRVSGCGCSGCAASVLSLVAAASVLLWWLSTPPSDSSRLVSVEIPARTGSAAIATRLRRAGIIRSATVFLWYARLHGVAGKLKSGVYLFSPNMTADEILARLQRRGLDTEDIQVTIPEGWTAAQIADALKERGVFRDRNAFAQLVKKRQTSIRAPFPIPPAGLEGYLYPDTYRFLPDTPPERVAQAMVDRFTSAFYDPHRASIDESAHSLNEIVTIASLIEREAEVERDRSRIAGVIENRLRRNMKLDIDATVLYALGHHKNRVLYRDLQVNSPYNTYRHKGLPPGPIASPGLRSLEAALTPEKHDYLYYVASPDGSHVFSRTLSEHNANVTRMREARGER